MGESDQDHIDMSYKDAISVMVDPESWDVTLRLGGTFYGFSGIQEFRAMVAHMDECASRLEELWARVQPVSDDDAGRAVDWWETNVRGIAEGQREGLDRLAECLGALRAMLGDAVDGQFLATARMAVRCFLIGKGEDESTLSTETQVAIVKLIGRAAEPNSTPSGGALAEWVIADTARLRRSLVGVLHRYVDLTTGKERAC